MTQSFHATSTVDLKIVWRRKEKTEGEREEGRGKERKRSEVIQRYNHEWL